MKLRYILLLFYLIFSVKFSIMFSQKIDYKKLKGKPIGVKYTKEIPDQYIFLYRDSSYTQAKEDKELPDIILSLGHKYEKVTPIFRLTYTINNLKSSIFKYNLKLNDSLTKAFIKPLVFERGLWGESNNIKGIEKKFFDVFKTVNMEFYELISKEADDPNYPEINKLKPLVKDANGVLNIEKLAKVIEENKASLAKYLD